ncbi:MAG TPA: glycosyltransferase [Ideonella sp.]|uniref:glycosyltransferase n=1 Tax=Ideonella sp. TaxID=1929293 RepID=UPI002E3268F5|nr:glycosyltransferase [Ideonella sp.]HEX5687553.1 glycosyltransferase [Ideonella sp.]
MSKIVLPGIYPPISQGRRNFQDSNRYAGPRGEPGCDSRSRRLVLLLTFGTVGDLQPFLTLAAALRDRGHRTLLVIPRIHEQLVRDTGLAYVPFGTREQAQAVLDDPELWNERKGFGVVWRGLLPSLDVICELLISHAQAQPCIVLSHPFLVPVAALARERQPDLHVVGTYLAPSNLRTIHDPLTIGSLHIPGWVPLSIRRTLWRAVDRFFIDPDLLPGLNASRAAQGLKPVTNFIQHMQAASDASVGLFPAWFANRQPDWPPEFVQGHFPLRHASPPPPLPADLEAFLAAGDPPIAFTPGTGHKHAASYFSNALNALRALGRRGLFITTYPEQVPNPLPPEVRWQSHAPFESLLPRLAMLVHHGGIGTTAEALRAGIPQLILPFAFDQFDNGRRVERLGAGKVMPAARANARRLRQQIARLLGGAAAPGRTVRPACPDVDQGLAQLVDSVERAMSVR